MMAIDDNSVNIPRGTATPKSYHHGDLRSVLIDTGMRLLEARSLNDLGLRELAREVGVSASAVYRHFPDKSALLDAIALRGFAMMGQTQAEIVSQHSGYEAFVASGVGYVQFALRHPAVFRLMFGAVVPRDALAADSNISVSPMVALRRNVANLAPNLSPQQQRILALRSWSIVHGLAVLALDGRIILDDDTLHAVIRSGSQALFAAGVT